MLAPALIFLGTYFVLAVGRLPGFRVDRTGAAIIGAGLMIAVNGRNYRRRYFTAALIWMAVAELQTGMLHGKI